MRKHLLSLLAAAALMPGAAQAWWNADYTQRTKVVLNTTAAGVETKEALSGVVVPVRLHSGNFDFLGAKPDGADLRVVAADDKTPLKFWVERFDGANELAVVWVQLPNTLPGTDKNVVHVYAGNEAAAAEATSPALFDGAMSAAFTFAGKAGEPATDASGQVASSGPVVREVNGLIGVAARLDGQPLQWSSDKLKAAGSGPYSVSLWFKPEALTGTLFKQGALSLNLDGGKAFAQLDAVVASGGELPPSAWAHLAVTVGNGKLTLYINGAQAAQADVPASVTPIEGPVSVGQGLSGLVDQLEVAASVRSADWLKFAHAAQSADAKLVLANTQTPETAEAGEGHGEAGHFAILVDNLTVDAWVVIVILAVMFVIAAWVMYDKAVLVGRADKDNLKFLENFRNARDVLAVETSGMKHSQLARLYQAGLRELKKREVGQAGAPKLSGASIDAVKAAVDADLIRESHTLNSKIVLLTIAISGGPFLGLLGTVVGVMITFAAIAAAGDVNVNAIAPGIAAALLATVAGLAVAIPALFGYNYLAARIKNISSDMGIFVDEFVTRVAETHGAR
ncbi:MAG: flagellar motor protein MotA [Burkholderiales bacterium RIFCSPHIGHO2_01_FULL_63_240]|nr:MAG: flagellar motor protein MotA [Burkholderiales bacterium RIFCSPHIGHO2_01_FULL_63_240]